jgi:carboxylesterase
MTVLTLPLKRSTIPRAGHVAGSRGPAPSDADTARTGCMAARSGPCAGTEAVLLIHGLGGTRQDLRSVHRHLAACGLPAFDVLLPGHGGDPRRLTQVGCDAWLAAIEQQLLALRARFDVVHVVGLCMGALLALQALKRNPPGAQDRGRLVLLSAPLFLDGWALPWYRAIRHVLYCIPPLTRTLRVKETFPFGVKDGRVRRLIQRNLKRFERYHHPWVPLRSIGELDRLRKMALVDMHRVTCETLIVHAIEDELTSINSALCLRDAINRGKQRTLAQLQVVSNSFHMICIDTDRELVADHVRRFLMPDDTPAAGSPCNPD